MYTTKARFQKLLTGMAFLLLLSLFVFLGCGEPEGVDAPPVESGSFEILSITQTVGFPRSAEIYDNTLYLSENYEGLTLWDISDLSNPVQIVSDSDYVAEQYRPVRVSRAVPSWNSLIVNGGNDVRVYTLDSLQLTTLDPILSAKQEILAVVRPDSVLMQYDNTVHEVDVLQLIILDQSRDDDVQKYIWYVDTLDFGQGPTPDTVQNHPFNSLDRFGLSPEDIAYTSSYDVIVAGLGDSGVGFADVSGTSTGLGPDGRWISTANTPGYVGGVAYSDGYVYAADGFNGLAVIDAHDVESPVLLSSWTYPALDHAFEIAAWGNYVALLDAFDGIFLLDVTDKMNPVLKGQYDVRQPTYAEFLNYSMPGLSEPTLLFTSEQDGVVIMELTY
ncbi:hypothetical protein K8I28_02000 [bacterium]|nr:hypothetical protein [bacterium]